MAPVPIHPLAIADSDAKNSLPPLLSTPGGLALLEVQGIINAPKPAAGTGSGTQSRIARLVFPDHKPGTPEGSPGSEWKGLVYLYIGHQRLRGEAMELKKPLALISRRKNGEGEELEIKDIVKWKLLFKERPEPVGLGET